MEGATVCRVPLFTREKECTLCGRDIVDKKSVRIVKYKRKSEETAEVVDLLWWCENCELPYMRIEEYRNWKQKNPGWKLIGFQLSYKWSPSKARSKMSEKVSRTRRFKECQTIGREKKPMRDIWGINRVGTPKSINSRITRTIETLRQYNGKCKYCKSDLVFGQTWVPENALQAIEINGLLCDQCDVLFIKDEERVVGLLADNLYSKTYTLNGKSLYGIGNQQETSNISLHDNEETTPCLTSGQTVYVYDGRLWCHYKGHKMDNYIAYMDSIFDEGTGFYVEYCHECEMFFMNYSDYDWFIQHYRVFPTRIEFWNEEDNKNKYLSQEEMSLLYLSGYSVNANKGYSGSERHSILAYIMNNGIMEKNTILDYLRLFISRNGKRKNMSIAVQKWEEDKVFVLNFDVEHHKKINIARLERRTGCRRSK